MTVFSSRRPTREPWRCRPADAMPRESAVPTSRRQTARRQPAPHPRARQTLACTTRSAEQPEAARHPRPSHPRPSTVGGQSPPWPVSRWPTGRKADVFFRSAVAASWCGRRGPQSAGTFQAGARNRLSYGGNGKAGPRQASKNPLFQPLAPLLRRDSWPDGPGFA